MARAFTPKDIHALMNMLVKEATGQSDISVTDTSSFVSAGETVLATGTENVINSLAVVIGRTFMAVRPYQAKLQIIQALNTASYTNRMRKISFYARENQASGDYNTDLYTNFATGYDNGQNGSQSTATMWEQNHPVTLEMNFAGSSVWQTSTTILENQLKVAFRSEAEFGEFVSGVMTEKANDIESTKEAFNRMVLLNKIAATYDMSADMPGSVINLTTLFNQKYGTNHTTADILSNYRTELMQLFTSTFKITSDYLTNRSTQYHWSPAKDGHVLLRHTPKDKQRFVYYSPFFTESKAMVFSEIFHPNYLMEENGEGVTYWQSIKAPSQIQVAPAIPDKTTGVQKKGSNVQLSYVLGVLYDVDGMMVDYQFDAAETTPLEARKRYRNIWWTFSKNAIIDQTENTVIFIMAD